MPDWTKGMIQTFEFHQVDPLTWADIKALDKVISASINRDITQETLETASLSANYEFSEMYIRIYLKTNSSETHGSARPSYGYWEVDNETNEPISNETRTPLGTFLIQTPKDSFDGKVHTYSYDMYSPLLELKDNPPPIGYFVPKGRNVMKMAGDICFANCRAPVIYGTSDYELLEDFVAESNDTWLSFVTDLIALAGFEIGLDELGQIIFLPMQETRALQPVWAYTDDNSSILYPDVTNDRDLYGIPNIVEVLYSDSGNTPMYARVENDDPESQTSTVTRGREVVYRDTSPAFNSKPTQEELERYAVKLLIEKSTLEYTVSYSHGYCPVRVGDCVVLNYERAGLHNVRAKVVTQSIDCSVGCKVDETAVYSVKLWEGPLYEPVY